MATTTPAGLAIVWTGAPQTNSGSYLVTATVNDSNYEGSASGSCLPAPRRGRGADARQFAKEREIRRS